MKPDLRARLERIAKRFSATKTPAGVRKVARRLAQELVRELLPVREDESADRRRQRDTLETALTWIILLQLGAGLARKPKK
jgi:hypothetical protein